MINSKLNTPEVERPLGVFHMIRKQELAFTKSK